MFPPLLQQAASNNAQAGAIESLKPKLKVSVILVPSQLHTALYCTASNLPFRLSELKCGARNDQPICSVLCVQRTPHHQLPPRKPACASGWSNAVQRGTRSSSWCCKFLCRSNYVSELYLTDHHAGVTRGSRSGRMSWRSWWFSWLPMLGIELSQGLRSAVRPFWLSQPKIVTVGLVACSYIVMASAWDVWF